MSNKLQVGIIGVGHIGKAHLRSYAACEQAEMVAVSDVNEVALKAAADEYQVARAFADYHDLLKRDDVKAVSVCTPPFAHCEITVAAAQAGKHVLVEKPMCMNAAEARQMVEACRQANVTLGVCHARFRFQQTAEVAKKYVESGELGKIYYARVSSLRRRGRPGLDILVNSKWFLDSSKAGGGTLADIGCYNIDALLYMLGSPQPVSVSAMTFRGVGQPVDEKVYDVEEHATVFVRFEGGVTAVFESAWASNMDSGDGFRLFGTKGGLKTNPFTVYTEQNGMQVDITPQLSQRQGSGNELINDFVQACLNDTPPKTPGEDGLKVMQIIDAAYQSAKLGRDVKVEELA